MRTKRELNNVSFVLTIKKQTLGWHRADFDQCQHQLRLRYIAFCNYPFGGPASDIRGKMKCDSAVAFCIDNGEIRSNYLSDIQATTRTGGETKKWFLLCFGEQKINTFVCIVHSTFAYMHLHVILSPSFITIMICIDTRTATPLPSFPSKNVHFSNIRFAHIQFLHSLYENHCLWWLIWDESNADNNDCVVQWNDSPFRANLKYQRTVCAIFIMIEHFVFSSTALSQ